jgi:hypothetical protein
LEVRRLACPERSRRAAAFLATRHSPLQWTAPLTMHLIEGSKEEIENTFRPSIEAFFEMYPEI